MSKYLTNKHTLEAMQKIFLKSLISMKHEKIYTKANRSLQQ